jgi:hypothetical protein
MMQLVSIKAQQQHSKARGAFSAQMGAGKH